MILDKSQRTEKYSSADFLHNMGIPVRIDAKHAIAHNKIMVIERLHRDYRGIQLHQGCGRAYLALVDGDKAAAASLTLAATLRDCRAATVPEATAPTGALTAAEAAKRLRVSPWTIYRLARTGKLPSYRAGSALHSPWTRSSVSRTKAGRPRRGRPPRCFQASSGTTASGTTS